MNTYFRRLHVQNTNGGFSLVELLVVVAILAILAAIAIPLFLNQKAKARTGALRSDLHNIIMEMEAIKPATGGFATDGTVQTQTGTSGYRKTSPNIIYIGVNCKFGTGVAVDASPGNYIVRGQVLSGGVAETGTSTFIYDGATGVWEEATNASYPARWTTLNTTPNCAWVAQY